MIRINMITKAFTTLDKMIMSGMLMTMEIVIMLTKKTSSIKE